MAPVCPNGELKPQLREKLRLGLEAFVSVRAVAIASLESLPPELDDGGQVHYPSPKAKDLRPPAQIGPPPILLRPSGCGSS